jgi:KRAB domain-containing zinc finger protein
MIISWNLSFVQANEGQKSPQPVLSHQADTAFCQPGPSHSHQSAAVSSNKHVCDFCSKCFSSAGNLKQHKLIHAGQKDHVCDFCKKAFTLAGHLKEHKLIHAGQKNHVCDVCLRLLLRPVT